MSRKNQDKGRLPQFIPIYKHTFNSKAYIALSPGARCALFELTARYFPNSQNAVFLSSRDGAERLGCCKDTTLKYLRELEHYGFIAVVRGAHLGVEGIGKATLYRLTDRPFAGEPATREFDGWDGVLFDPKKQNPVRKSRTPRQTFSDIKNGARMSQKRNKCPTPSDIRDDIECPTFSDISRYTTPSASDSPSPLPPWSTPVLNEVSGEDREELLRILAPIPAQPYRSLADLRQAMGYRH
jgi:hypothetical protein